MKAIALTLSVGVLFSIQAYSQNKPADFSGWESLKKNGLAEVKEQEVNANYYSQYRPLTGSESFQASESSPKQSPKSVPNQVPAVAKNTPSDRSSSSRRYSFVEKQSAEAQSNHSTRQPSQILPRQQEQVPQLVSTNNEAVYQVAQLSSNP